MRDKLIRLSLLGLGAISGSFGTLAIFQARLVGYGTAPTVAAAVIIGGLLGLALMYVVFRGVVALVGLATQSLNRTALPEILAGVIGLIPALVIGVLISLTIPRDLALIGPYLPFTVTLAVGYTGMVVAIRKRDELQQVLGSFRHGAVAGGESKRKVAHAAPKILDTSTIIDGRILDVGRSGFIEGRLIIPGFVLRELQHIADSTDALKRNRGRRGLDVLKRMQLELSSPVEVLDQDFEDVLEVDDKVVRLAKTLGGKVLTNDFNLNSVCELHGVLVLNLNDLANAVKPAVLPGEELTLQVVKDGKEPGQGVGYLEDGTMIVVDGGRRFIGESVDVVVTSVLQTSAGRLVFAKPKGHADRQERAF